MKSTPKLLAFLASSLLAAPSLHALTYYWDNAAADGFGAAGGTWSSTASLWSESATGAAAASGTVVTTTSDTVNFGTGSTTLTTGTITVSGTVSTGNITFGSASGAITLSGGTISVGGGRTISAQNNGNVIGSNIQFTGGNGTISFSRNSADAGTMTINGEISGAGNVTFTTPNVNSGGNNQVIVLGSANNWTGNTTITAANINNSTIIQAGANNALPTTTVLTLDGGNGTGSGRTVAFDLANRTHTIAGLTNVTGRTSRNQQITNRNTGTATLTINNSTDHTFSGDIINGNGTVRVTKSGTGTQTLANGNTYSGITTINGGALAATVLANGGTASSIGQSGSAATNLVFGAPTATLRYTGSANASTNRSFTLSSGVGGGATIESSGTGTLTLTASALAYGTADQTRALTLGGTNTGNNVFGPAIVDNGSGLTSLAKTGPGTWVLTGAKTYTGTTTVAGGTLRFATSEALYNDNTSNWTAANLNVKSGGALAFNVGGTGEFTAGNVSTLLTNLAASSSPTTGMNAGSSLGFDTTNAAGGTFTIADGLADTTGDSGGARGLAKLGINTLTLTGTNTYTGATTISGGTLEVQGSIASSSAITNNGALVLNSDSAASYGSVISGTGTLTKQGTGTLTLTATNTYTGTTTISAGVLQLGDSTSTGSLGNQSNTFIAAGAELRINRLNTGSPVLGYDYSGVLSGSGTVNILASRRLNFRNVNQTATGDLSFVVNGVLGINTSTGTKEVHLGELTGSGTIQRAGSAPSPSAPPYTLIIGGKNTSSTYSGTVGSFAELGVEKVGSGTLTLTNTFSHGAATTVTAGTLALGSAGNLPNTSAFNIAAGATLSTTAKTSFAMPAAKTFTFGVNAAGSGSSGTLTAQTLDITNGVCALNITGTLDDPAYVLATYTAPLIGTAFATEPTIPSGYQLQYNYQGNKIALVAVASGGFDSWKAANNATGGLGDDHDNDGVSNGIEYFIGGPSGVTSGFTPQPSLDEETMSITWTKGPGYTGTYGTHFWVESSDTLADPWAVETIPGGNITDESGFVKFTFPNPLGTKKFARLKVVGP